MRWQWLSKVLPIAAMLCLGVILGFFQSHHTPGVLVATPENVRVVIRDRHDELEPKTIVELQNLGRGHVEVLDVNASCGCTVAKLGVKHFPAGGRTKMEIAISQLPVGKKTSIVTVRYVADSPKVLQIPIEIIVDEPAKPRFLNAPTELSLNSADQNSRVFQIEVKEPARSSPLLTSIHCSDSRLDARLIKSPESHSWDEAFVVRIYEIAVSMRSSLDAAAEFGAYLTFEFSESVLEVSDVPVLVKFHPIARAIPSGVECEISSETVFPIQRKLYLVAKPLSDPWQIESTGQLPAWLRVELGDVSGESSLTPLNFEVTDAIHDMLRGTDNEYVSQITLIRGSDGSSVAIPLKFSKRY